MQTDHALGTIAVVGCGLIGASWAALFLAHGYRVTAWDPSEESRHTFRDRIALPLSQLHELDNSLKGSTDSLNVFDTLADAVRQADFVQENAPEKTPLKRALYAEIIQSAPEHAIISSSTSSLTWSDLSAELPDKGRLITAHPFNPPHLMPLVELFAANPAIGKIAEDFYASLARDVVILKKDAVGHIANRLSSALWREAVNIVAEGIADVSAVDRALVSGPGLRWSVVGSHMAYHLGGGEGGIRHYLQHLGPSQESRWKTLGNPKLTQEVCQLLIEGVLAEANGKSIAELEAARDAGLLSILKTKGNTDV
ncbi:3-hydroxyacyl-CoA dehydrogenase NAD-binding domain-containing protein [Brucella anthropi]|uniref:3-hydroxyacyl-CoA dehydrogenase n=1 Tax=Brucella anthropi TaxID=529 RepID=A0A6L3Z159_BRUAN|nr:3-hydroxyacyl-CoA dehydrogenase NAD-binding domain-containing protein [Brucella anthropi]KAB2764278.1 3-hydroxyacyl-CoA dehydrogenase [Brucella anthropi]